MVCRLKVLEEQFQLLSFSQNRCRNQRTFRFDSLVSEVEGLREDIKLPEGISGKAFILESVKDKSKGNVSSVVLIQGNLCQGNCWLQVNEKLYIEKLSLITEMEKSLFS